MNSKERRRRQKMERRISFKTMIILFLLFLLIPLLCYWYGVKRAERVVPDHATGYVVEVTPSDMQ